MRQRTLVDDEKARHWWDRFDHFDGVGAVYLDLAVSPRLVDHRLCIECERLRWCTPVLDVAADAVFWLCRGCLRRDGGLP